MKIVTALAVPDELEALVEAGADELYCGVVPERFLDSAGRSRLNRRYDFGANIRTLDEFAAVAARARAKNVPVSVTLNEHAYAPALLPTLVDLARGLEAAGARALIVTDLGLILALRKAGLAIDLHLSSVATCTNSQSASFFADLGVKRVILPRYLSTRQIARLVEAGAPVEYEVFVINDGCGFEEGLCLNLHRPWGPMCQMDWRTEPEPPDGPDRAAPGRAFANPHLPPDWHDNWKAYRYLMGYLDHPGGSVTPEGVPNGPCGVCALPALKAAGVGHVKIPGREYSRALRFGALRFVRTVLDWVERGDPAPAVIERAKALKGTPVLCDSTYLCYFREGLGADRSAPGRPRALGLDDLEAAARYQRSAPASMGGDEPPRCEGRSLPVVAAEEARAPGPAAAPAPAAPAPPRIAPDAPDWKSFVRRR